MMYVNIQDKKSKKERRKKNLTYVFEFVHRSCTTIPVRVPSVRVDVILVLPSRWIALNPQFVPEKILSLFDVSPI